MAKRLVPLFNRILIEKIVPPSKTTSGILLPEKTPKLNSGKVIAVGTGVHDRDGKLIPVTVKEGDTVLLPEYGGTVVKLGDKEYHLYRGKDVLATLHDKWHDVYFYVKGAGI
uniref:Protein groES n=1 Tax=Rhizophora mucronata TaxID=61149 RepID=A0A2P2INR0_RHIMU